MFQLCKNSINLVEHLEKETEMVFGECGTDTYEVKGDDADGYCPFCEHKGCFKVRQNEEEMVNSFYHCFSCEEHGSVIDWTMKKYDLDAVSAAKKLADEYKLD